MNDHYIVKLINGYYCTLCYKFRKEKEKLEEEKCEQDRERWNDEELGDVHRIEFR